MIYSEIGPYPVFHFYEEQPSVIDSDVERHDPLNPVLALLTGGHRVSGEVRAAVRRNLRPAISGDKRVVLQVRKLLAG